MTYEAVNETKGVTELATTAAELVPDRTVSKNERDMTEVLNGWA